MKITKNKLILSSIAGILLLILVLIISNFSNDNNEELTKNINSSIDKGNQVVETKSNNSQVSESPTRLKKTPEVVRNELNTLIQTNINSLTDDVKGINISYEEFIKPIDDAEPLEEGEQISREEFETMKKEKLEVYKTNIEKLYGMKKMLTEDSLIYINPSLELAIKAQILSIKNKLQFNNGEE